MRHPSTGADTYAVPSSPTQGQSALRRLVDSANVLIWMTDANDRCKFVNPSVQTWFDNTGPIHLEDWLALIHSDDLETVRSTLAIAKETRKESQCEYRIVKSDGTICWMLGLAAPRFARDGSFAGYSGALVDITAQRQAHLQLAASDPGYRLLAEQISDLICHCDADGVYTYVSPSYSQALGCDAATLIGENAYDRIHPRDRLALQVEVRRQLHDKADGRVVEMRIRHHDGHYLWIGTKTRVLRDPATGAMTGAVAVSRDITQEREARENLRTSEERFRSLAELSSDWYWETDAQERLTFVSSGKHRRLGIETEELLGRRRDEFAIDPNHPGVIDYRQKYAQRKSFRNLPFAGKLPDGRVFHSSLSGEPMYQNGVFIGYRGVGRDVTAERELLEKLSHLVDTNNALVQNSPDIIMVFDGEDRIRHADGAVMDILGYAPDELIGRHYLDFVSPEMRDDTAKIMELVHDKNAALPRFEGQWVRKDGRVVHLSWAGRRSASRELIYTTARDVTEVHQARAELERINRRLNTTLESIDDAFFSVDKEWRLTYLNLKTAEFAGIVRDEAIGKPLWEAVPGLVETSIFAQYQRAMQTGKKIFFEDYYEPANAWVDVRAYPHDEGLSVYFHDITERHETERLIHEREQRFRELIALTPAGYLEANGEGIVLDVNPALCEMSGFAREEFLGRNITAFVGSTWSIDETLKSQDGTSPTHGKEIVFRHKQGHLVHLLANLTFKRDIDGNTLSLTAFLTDITDRKQVADQLEHLATHDLLTGLPNRILIHRHLQKLLDADPSNEAVALMFIDLDRFKQINDSMGHAVGDQVLRLAARRLERQLAPTDMLARFGGDEFIVAARCADGQRAVAALAESLLALLAAPFEVDGHEIFINASIGIAMLAEGTRTIDVLFQNADSAMFRAKASGRNSYRFFKAEMTIEAKARMELEGALRYALDRGEFQLHYQPQVDLCTGRVVGVEALLRWQHPEWGMVSPMRFIPIAEETGLIVPIGAWVLRTACMQAANWRAADLGELRIAVNLSARQFAQPNLVQFVESVLEETGLPAQQLDLELTESMVMKDIDRTIEVLNRLKNLGIKLSVDDFGTGYSSLSYLKRFPIDMLKIDRSFVQEISHYSYDAAIPDAIIAMAHSLGIRVIAEGVETEVQCEVLARKMCDEIQGYLYSEALPADDMTVLLHGAQALPARLLRMHKRRRVLLLVDDEPNILSALKRQLRGADYQILTAGSGSEGLELLRTSQVDVIVSDQRMPGMTGVDFLRTVKELYPETVRIVLSGFTELQAVTDAVNEGAIYKFLTKPWDDSQLREHIAEAFTHKEMADENRRLSLEVRTANQGLAAANRRLEDVLRQQQQRIKHDEITLDIVREVLQHVPVPVIGLDEDHVVVFANTAAHHLFPGAGLPLGGDAQDLIPEILSAIRELKEGQVAPADLGGRFFDVTYRRMGRDTHSRGILITLTPSTLANSRKGAARIPF